jgi:hypothetical protein
MADLQAMLAQAEAKCCSNESELFAAVRSEQGDACRPDERPNGEFFQNRWTAGRVKRRLHGAAIRQGDYRKSVVHLEAEVLPLSERPLRSEDHDLPPKKWTGLSCF